MFFVITQVVGLIYLIILTWLWMSAPDETDSEDT